VSYTGRVFRVIGAIGCLALAAVAAVVWVIGRTSAIACSSALIAAIDPSDCQRVTLIHDLAAATSVVAGLAGPGLLWLVRPRRQAS